MEKVIILISPDGDVSSEVKGVAGPACKNLDKQILKALGEVISEKKTPDYHKRIQPQLRTRQ